MSLQKALRLINVPAKHHDADLSKCHGLDHLEPIQGYLDKLSENVRNGNSLVLFGEYSQGKSAIAAIILREALRLGLIGYWMPMREWAKHQIEKTTFDSTYDISVEAHCMSCPIMVLDEFILRDKIMHNEQAIEHVLRARADANLATIVTTNLSWRRLETEYPAISAAMVGVYKWVKVAGYDFRADKENRRG